VVAADSVIVADLAAILAGLPVGLHSNFYEDLRLGRRGVCLFGPFFVLQGSTQRRLQVQ